MLIRCWSIVRCRRSYVLSLAVVVFSSVLATPNAAGQQAAPRLFDRYERICDEDEQARLDFFQIEFRKELPGARMFVVTYGGRCYSDCMADHPRHRPQFPRRKSEQAWGTRIKNYLIEVRGMSPNQIVLLDGGHRESWEAELWIVPRGSPGPPLSPTVKLEDIVYKKGKVTQRELRAGCAKRH